MEQLFSYFEAIIYIFFMCRRISSFFSYYTLHLDRVECPTWLTSFCKPCGTFHQRPQNLSKLPGVHIYISQRLLQCLAGEDFIIIIYLTLSFNKDELTLLLGPQCPNKDVNKA